MGIAGLLFVYTSYFVRLVDNFNGCKYKISTRIKYVLYYIFNYLYYLILSVTHKLATFLLAGIKSLYMMLND